MDRNYVEPDSVRTEMVNHIRSINKVLTEDYLQELEIGLLMGECHPNYRDYFATKLKNEKK